MQGDWPTPSRLVLKKLCVDHKPDFLFIAEPWMLLSNFPSSFWTQLGLKPFVVNSRHPLGPNIWCLCKLHLTPHLIAATSQHVSLSIASRTSRCLLQRFMPVPLTPTGANCGLTYPICSSPTWVLGVSSETLTLFWVPMRKGVGPLPCNDFRD